MKSILEKLFISPRKAKAMLKAQGIEDELVGKVGYLILEAQGTNEFEKGTTKITGLEADNLAKRIIKIVKANL
jgi:hypothetical protein